MRGRCCGCCRTGCLDRLFLLFPDPWPKARHAKRRFVHPALLPLLARVLKPGAEWRVASDDPTYQAWVAEVMAAQTLFDAPAARRPNGRRTGRRRATRRRRCARAGHRATGRSSGVAPADGFAGRSTRRPVDFAVQDHAPAAVRAPRSARAATMRPGPAARPHSGIQSAVNSAASPCASGGQGHAQQLLHRLVDQVDAVRNRAQPDQWPGLQHGRRDPRERGDPATGSLPARG